MAQHEKQPAPCFVCSSHAVICSICQDMQRLDVQVTEVVLNSIIDTLAKATIAGTCSAVAFQLARVVLVANHWHGNLLMQASRWTTAVDLLFRMDMLCSS
eukprot:6218014-Amphidinium_carterae.1